MDGIVFRTEPQESDIESVRQIVATTGFYGESEISVAVDLVQERLDRGLACDYLFIFADYNGKAVSFVCFGPIPCAKNNFEMYWMATHGDYRCMGIGGEVLKRAERVVWAFSGRALYLSTSSRHIFMQSRDFFQKNGYRIDATLFNFYDENEHRMIFTKSFI